MLATALFNRGTGSKGSPEEKGLQSRRTRCIFTFLFCGLCSPCSFSIASLKWWLSSQMLCSTELPARPKVRRVVMAKRRCLLHTCPLLKNRPAGRERNHKTRLRQEPRGRWSTPTLMGCRCVWVTWVPWINPGRHRAVRPVHKVVSLRHDGFFYHLPPRNKHCFVSSQTNAEHIPVNVSELWMQGQRIWGLLSDMWLWWDAYFVTIIFSDRGKYSAVLPNVNMLTFSDTYYIK